MNTGNEIMIRVWHPSQNKMSTEMVLPMLAGYLYAIYPNLSDEIFLRWTGLEDAFGKHIYEDDLIAFGGLGTFRIIFKDGRFQDERGHLNLTQEGTRAFAEVIGNVHENPEMLTEES